MSDDRVTSRAAHPLPEETGVDDPARQAAALLAESDARTDDAADGPNDSAEHRTSDEATT